MDKAGKKYQVVHVKFESIVFYLFLYSYPLDASAKTLG